MWNNMNPIGCLLLVIVSAYGAVVTNYNQLGAAKQGNLITLKDLQVPAGVTLDLTKLKPGTTVEFSGRTTFGYHEWAGPLVKVSGKNLKIVGLPGNLLDGEGKRWWDGQGGNGGVAKPRFMEVNIEDSTISGLNIKNPPAWCFVANYCKNIHISNLNIDIKDGDKKAGGHNTDGIGVGYSNNVTILNCKVHNQDDCFVTGAGSDILIDNLSCTGGHGISIGSLGRGAVVERVTVKNSKIIKNMVGVRIKSTRGETGAIRDITFDNIELQGITRYGIIVEGNYLNSGSAGDATPFPIENIVFNNVRGSVVRKATNIYVNIHPTSGKNWRWSNINVTGGQKELKCVGVPAGLNVNCGKK
uniref:endo-polygalacturonase n=1 Tax=Lygus lineolaris TaxID=50650 RepID=A0A126CR09_LYGLI|nr:polygalacturonase 1 [Lygus lineolaris]